MAHLTNHPVWIFLFSCCILTISAWLGTYIRRRRRDSTGAWRDDLGVVEAATLTLLALIIGFSFSMAVDRYNQRKIYEEDEANAIGTEYLRVGLLQAADVVKVRGLLVNTSISGSCSIPPPTSNSFSRSMPAPISCRPNCGPWSRLRVTRNRPLSWPWR